MLDILDGHYATGIEEIKEKREIIHLTNDKIKRKIDSFTFTNISENRALVKHNVSHY